MLVKNWWLTGAIFFVGISILASAYWVANSLSNRELVLNNIPAAIVQADKNGQDLLSLSEAADYLKISEERLKKLMEESKFIDGKGIPFLKIHSEIWFNKKALSDWTEYSANNNFEY